MFGSNLHGCHAGGAARVAMERFGAVWGQGVEQAYKGNFHLLATIDGRERKYVIGKNRDAFSLIEQTGAAHLTAAQLRTLVTTCFGLG